MGPGSDLKWQLIACLPPKPSRPRISILPSSAVTGLVTCLYCPTPAVRYCYIPKIKDKVIDTLLPCSPFFHPELWGWGLKCPLQNPIHLVCWLYSLA